MPVFNNKQKREMSIHIHINEYFIDTTMAITTLILLHTMTIQQMIRIFYINIRDIEQHR